MRRRVPLQKLRGSDPTLLEIQIQDLLSRPGSQLEPLNLLDLYALAEHPEPPKRIKHALETFVDRVAQEISGIPDGSALREFAAEYDDLEGGRVPTTFRELLTRLGEREGRESGLLLDLVARWEGVEPEPFQLGVAAPKIQRATIANAPATSAPRTRTQRNSDRASTAQPKVASSSRAKPMIDIDKHNWIVEVVLQRLAESSETGLGEAVLVAGIKHRAKDVYPMLAPQDITQALQDLLKVGRVRKSAGRWSRAR